MEKLFEKICEIREDNREKKLASEGNKRERMYFEEDFLNSNLNFCCVINELPIQTPFLNLGIDQVKDK